MFVGKAMRKYWTWLEKEKLAKDKPSSLLRKSVNYGRNKFYSTGPGGKGVKLFSLQQNKLESLKAFSAMLNISEEDQKLTSVHSGLPGGGAVS